MAIPDFLKGEVVSLDTETAVLGDHVIELGLSVFRDAALVYEWGTYIKPVIPIDPECTKIHNIQDKDVESSPMFADIAPILLNYLKSADLLVAYNYDYDRGVLGNEFTRLGIQFPVKPMVDPFIWFKQWHKYEKGKKLVKAAEVYGVQYVGAHRAVNDATATGKVLMKMAATKTDFPRDIKSCMKKQRKMIEDQFEDLQAYFIKIGKGKINPPNYQFYDVV